MQGRRASPGPQCSPPGAQPTSHILFSAKRTDARAPRERGWVLPEGRLGPLAMRCVGRPAAARGNLRYGILPTTRRTLPLSLWPPRLRLVTTWAGHPARKLHV